MMAARCGRRRSEGILAPQGAPRAHRARRSCSASRFVSRHLRAHRHARAVVPDVLPTRPWPASTSWCGRVRRSGGDGDRPADPGRDARPMCARCRRRRAAPTASCRATRSSSTTTATRSRTGRADDRDLVGPEPRGQSGRSTSSDGTSARRAIGRGRDGRGTAREHGFHVGDSVDVLLDGPAERFRIVGSVRLR